MAQPVFLSYAWDGVGGVEAPRLDEELGFRGVPVWRDRREMRLGTYNETRVRDAIASECSGFLLYATAEALESAFITRVELPAMDCRRGAAPNGFFAAAV